MKINELVEMQKNFDKAHKGKHKFYEKITDENIDVLEHLIVCIAGELGEFANIVKKISRGDFKLKDVENDLNMELADISIYLLKIYAQLDLDAEKLVLEKMEKNKKKLQRYEI